MRESVNGVKNVPPKRRWHDRLDIRRRIAEKRHCVIETDRFQTKVSLEVILEFLDLRVVTLGCGHCLEIDPCGVNIDCVDNDARKGVSHRAVFFGCDGSLLNIRRWTRVGFAVNWSTGPLICGESETINLGR
jgi:hypothetical protein